MRELYAVLLGCGRWCVGWWPGLAWRLIGKGWGPGLETCKLMFGVVDSDSYMRSLGLEPLGGVSWSSWTWMLGSSRLSTLWAPRGAVDSPIGVGMGEEGRAVCFVVVAQVAVSRGCWGAAHLSLDLALCRDTELLDGGLAGQREDHHQSRTARPKHH